MSEPVTLWRIATDTPNYASDDLSGKGASMTGGRWNRKDTPVVYTSTTRALACLETLMHLSPVDPLPLNRYLVSITVSLDVWKKRVLFDQTHNVGWDAEPAGIVSLNWGTQWLKERSTLLAVVPSVIIPEEDNILINPAHADVGKLTVKKVRKWTYDQRT